MEKLASIWTIPNLLSGFRLLSAPFLLLLAWFDYANAFLVLLLLAFVSDALDGFFARLLNQVSEFGAQLDSWGDFVIYTTTALGGWWLWPERILAEITTVLIIITSFVIPVIAGFIKFKRFTSYHTWAVKTAVALIAISVLIFYALGSTWPLQIAAFICVIAAIEQLLITVKLNRWVSDIPTLFHLPKKS